MRALSRVHSPGMLRSQHTAPVARQRSGPHSHSPPQRKWRRSVVSCSRQRPTRAGSHGRRGLARRSHERLPKSHEGSFRSDIDLTRRQKPFARRGFRATSDVACRRSLRRDRPPPHPPNEERGLGPGRRAEGRVAVGTSPSRGARAAGPGRASPTPRDHRMGAGKAAPGSALSDRCSSGGSSPGSS